MAPGRRPGYPLHIDQTKHVPGVEGPTFAIQMVSAIGKEMTIILEVCRLT